MNAAGAPPYLAFASILTKGGYTIIDGGRYRDLSEDYSSQIT